MRKRILWGICVLFLCGAALTSRAASYEELWKQVKQYERKDLPKSAYEVVERIAEKADKDGRKGQRMAALLYGCKLRQQIVPDSFYTDILKLERLKRQTTDEVERAVLASVLGGLYRSNDDRNRNYGERTDTHPDSIREWSSAQFLKVSEENYAESMAHPELLAEAKAADYMPFVERGEDAAYFDGDLLNVIGRRAAYSFSGLVRETCVKSAPVFGKMLSVYRSRGNREAELFVMLDSVQECAMAEMELLGGYAPVSEALERKVLQSDAYKTYMRMLSRFGDLPEAAEVYIGMLDELIVTDSLKMRWAEEGYAQYKAYPRAKALLNEKRELEAPSLTLDFPSVVNPDVPFDGEVRHRNVNGLELRWYLLPDGKPNGNEEKKYQKNKEAYVKEHGRLQKTEHLDWAQRAAYVQACDTFRLQCPGIGYYVVIGKVDGQALKDLLWAEFCSTRLAMMHGFLPDSVTLCTVVDGKTGSPVAGATVKWYARNELVHSAQTDAEGKARWHYGDYLKENKNPRVLNIEYYKGDDRCNLGGTIYVWRSGSPAEKKTEKKERLYTDRAIYRPGQTVYVGGLCTDEMHWDEMAVEGRKVALELRDPNGKTVAEQTVESDEMGTFSASFTLPSTGMSGRYVVKSGKSVVDFTVEEYKRPTFEVRLDEAEECRHVGDTLYLTGEAMNYNGTPLRGGRVSAETSVARWFYSNSPGEDVQALDTVYTDADGKFTLEVPVRKMDRQMEWRGMRQLVHVAVLSPTGETQEASVSFPLAKEGMAFTIKAGETVLLRDSLPPITTVVRTASGAVWRDTVVITCDVYHAPEGQARTKVLSGIRLPANRATRIAELSTLPSGRYEMDLLAVSREDTVKCAAGFTLVGLADTRLADPMKMMFRCVSDTVSPGRPAHLMIGSTEDSVSLYYMLFCENHILEEKLYHFSDSILHFVYPDVPEGADGMQALFYFYKEGKYYHAERHIVRRQPDRSLQMSWISFRDHLQPGAEETWQLRVALPDGRPAPAQLMSVLYDASLDGIKPHVWSLQRYFPYSLPSVNMENTTAWWSGGYSMRYFLSPRYFSVRQLSFDEFDFSMLDWQIRRLVNGEMLLGKQTASVTMTIADHAAPMAKSNMVLRSPVAANAYAGRATGTGVLEEEVVSEGCGGIAGNTSRVAVRGDLRETAFFYPRLMADSAGVVILHFTLPEGLTTWKFMALAHTKDMFTGVFSDEVVAQKDVMAQLNLPRFVRKGDRATLSATLFNLTEAPLSGTVTMEVFDPATEEVLWQESRKMTVGADADTMASFVYEPDGAVSLPACRVLFAAGSYTDGEQRYLPILEDKEWLTQTRPFVVSHKGDTVIRLDGLFQGNHRDADHRRLTVEYTANPLWYAVQALPSVLEPRTDDVQSLAAAYYAATLSAKLAGQYPQMKTAVEAWQREGGEATKSPLATQEDLTGIVLEETPWVADAEAGTRRMEALRQLFDVNRQADLRRQFAGSLGKLQCADGSFSWFGGMKGSPYMTRGVARQLLRSGAGRHTDEVLAEAVNVRKMMEYLMSEAHKDIEKDKEHRAKYKTSLYDASYWLETLYLMNLCDAAWLNADRKDTDYMLSRLTEGMHGLAMADKAEAAVVLHRMGRGDEAAQLVRSIREHLVDGAEGLHIECPSNGFVGFGRKMAVHTMLMEALALAGGSGKAETDGLCRWLLAQKRLQDWGTSTASMDAVYALLQGQKEDLTLRADDEVRLESPKGEAWAVLRTSHDGLSGLGTVSATVEGRELDSGAGILRVTKSEETPSAWGAAYAQFRLPLSEVESAASGLRVRVETDNLSPRVGDRLTLRYVLTSDRDYEYVRLKAGRAACLEPVEALSGYAYRNGLGYYREVKDASTEYFFERLPKGTYVLEMECYVERPGRYTVGAAKLNGLYAPEFSAYGAGMTLDVRP